MSLALLFMSAQALAALPALVNGTTVMVAADDLRMIYARGVVTADTLTFDAPLPAGVSVQLLFYPHAADDSSEAETREAGAGLHSVRATVDASGGDLFVLDGNGSAVSLSDWLRSQHGISLILPGG